MLKSFINNKTSVNKKSFNNCRSITINNGKVIIDGVDVTEDSKKIEIVVNGNIESISADYVNSIKVVGNVGKAKTMSGDVSCKGSVSGKVKTMSGDIKIGK